MATAASSRLIPLETYLHTSYEPDVEYVDGELEERNVGELDHNMIQRAILFWFYSHEKEWGIRAIQDLRRRHQSSPSGRERFLARASDEQVFYAPPVDCDRGPVPERT